MNDVAVFVVIVMWFLCGIAGGSIMLYINEGQVSEDDAVSIAFASLGGPLILFVALLALVVRAVIQALQGEP
jgi:hypothetical protein